MHDRRIDGETHTFGNYGALYKNAMTWYDHKTESIWSQPIGRAIAGEYLGVELFVIPSQLTTWGEWKDAYPDSLAMINDVDRLGNRRQGFQQNYVVGLLLNDQAKAYYYKDVADRGVINDSLAGLPIVVWADDASLQAYLRKLDDRTLTFESRNGQIVDAETSSRWDMARGIAAEGPLQGTVLQPVPSSTAYDWAWQDFYPDSEFYSP